MQSVYILTIRRDKSQSWIIPEQNNPDPIIRFIICKIKTHCVQVCSWSTSVLQIFEEYAFDSGYEDLSTVSGSDGFDTRYEQLDLDLSASASSAFIRIPNTRVLDGSECQTRSIYETKKRRNKLKPYPVYKFKDDVFQPKDFASIDKHAEQVKISWSSVLRFTEECHL